MNYLNKIEVTRITNVIFIAAYELWFLTSRYNVNNIKYPKERYMHVYILSYIDCHSNLIQILILVIAIWRRELFLNHGA